jgi:prefoldin alpha subunit
MNTLNLALDELVGAEGKEIQAPVGRGIFVKAKLLSENLTVDVGGKNFVVKSIPDTKKIIAEQTEKLTEVRGTLDSEIEKLNNELMKMMGEAQAEQGKEAINSPEQKKE